MFKSYRSFLWIALLALIAKLSAFYWGLSPLLWAILYGMILGNVIPQTYLIPYEKALQWCKKTLLRLAIVLYGFNLSLQSMQSLGAAALFLDAFMVGSTFLLACWLGKRFCGLDRDSSMLIGAGASVCGAAAVLGAQSVVRAEDSKVALAVATVVLFGTLSMMLLPILGAAHIIPFPPEIFGVYVGAVVHEVAQVVAVGGILGEAVAPLAVLSKMVRVLMLLPLLWLLAHALNRQSQEKTPFPYFALGFLVTALLNSFTPDGAWKRFIMELDTILLAMAMVALGLSTQFKSMKRFGWRPFFLAALLWLWLLLGGALLTWWLLC